MLNNSINRFLGVLCYPFISLEYQQEDLFENYIKAKTIKERKKIKKELQKNLIKYIKNKYTLYSYDEIYLYLEKCFLFEIDYNDYNDLDNYKSAYSFYRKKFSDLARALISQRNGKLVFKYWENFNDKNLLGGFSGNNKVLLFHNLNRCIPLDLIAIIYLIDNDVSDTSQLNNFYGHIEVSDMQLDYILNKGVSENHLHKGVSRSFLSIWESLVKPLTKQDIDNFNDLNNNYLKEKNKYTIFNILSCGIIRAIISHCVKNQINLDKIDFEKNKNDCYIFIYCLLKNGSEELYKRITNDDNDTASIYCCFINLWNMFLENIDNYNDSQNIVFQIFKENLSLNTSGENLFLFKTFLFLKDTSDNEHCYIKKLLINYIRIKNNLFEFLVQQKTVKGLDYFQLNYYSKNSYFNWFNTNYNYWEYAMREQFQNNNLHKIEFRCSIEENENKFRQNILNFLKSYQKILHENYCKKEFYNDIDEFGNTIKKERYIPVKKFPLVGLVYHFLKRVDATCPYKCYEKCKYSQDSTNLYFQANISYYKKLITVLKKFRDSNSELSRYIVGIDAASLENSTPVWVFSEIYEIARDSKNEPLFVQDGLNTNFQSLGFTFHAGEDFRHILSGIRRIDEAVRHLKFHAGDRIGHGIALGLSPDIWRRENRCIIIPRIEALENYIWAYDILSQNYGDFNTSIIAYLEKNIYMLAKEIYVSTEGMTVPVLIDAYLKQFQLKIEDMISFNDDSLCDIKNKKSVIWNSEKLVMARNCGKFLINMNEPIHFEITEQDIEIAKYTQKVVKQNLSRAGIVIEINPTSNVSIAHADNLTENHIYNINNFSYDASNVIACINSDDPSIFNTNVSNELAYVYYGMLEKNISKEEALKWIDKLRENGISSSFIKRNESDENILYKLDKLIKSL